MNDDLLTLFLTPLDVLFLRGNKLFGDAGSHGEALLPPWPSLAAGALRSALLAQQGVDLAAFARDDHPHPQLGTPSAPGDFAIRHFGLACRDAAGHVHSLHALPADLVVQQPDKNPLREVRRLHPQPPPAGLRASMPLPQWPILAEGAQRAKAESGLWLTGAGWQRYLDGESPRDADIVASKALWKFDPRVGIGLSADTRSADDGKLFTAQAIALSEGVGFVVQARACPLRLPTTLRLGGDGRGAQGEAVSFELPRADHARLARDGRLRLVLTSPALFRQGWLPDGCTRRDDGRIVFDLHGVRGELVSAAVPRAEVVSGFDLARWQPKAAERAAPTGSVYWLDKVEATPAALDKLATEGLWPAGSDDRQNTSRRAEGFNRCALAVF